ncbi:hypothetical protein Dda_1175 [Drechslerella dactyloides]|uniref:GPI transamidase component GPI16 n=1 Tax=Drechslerella dactyloides TaxID=74499 RepID=A0AAD6J7G2_DREDA|nr:hypothetical protein Dda_1175 [Drechslerella dactyloides]
MPSDPSPAQNSFGEPPRDTQSFLIIRDNLVWLFGHCLICKQDHGTYDIAHILPRHDAERYLSYHKAGLLPGSLNKLGHTINLLPLCRTFHGLLGRASPRLIVVPKDVQFFINGETADYHKRQQAIDNGLDCPKRTIPDASEYNGGFRFYYFADKPPYEPLRSHLIDHSGEVRTGACPTALIINAGRGRPDPSAGDVTAVDKEVEREGTPSEAGGSGDFQEGAGSEGAAPPRKRLKRSGRMTCDAGRQWLPYTSSPLLLLLSRLLPAFLLFSLAGRTVADTYDETLRLQPLSGQFLLASFNFRSHGPIQAFNKQMFQLFPRSLGQILQYTHTRELHLRFALGRWDSELWGAQPDDGQNAGGTGVELWAWVEADDDVEAEARWTSLNNALSGLFCASLNFIDSTRTIRPVMSFSPTGDYPTTNTSRLFLLHGTLPKEPVCTENLTPFLKLLPCKGKFGISTLLDGHKLFDASFQSMSIDVRPICSQETGECDVEIQQNIDMVLDIARSLQRKDSPVPRPRDQHELICDTTKPYGSTEYCFPLDNSFDLPWSLSDLFGKSITGRCPFAVRPDTEVAHVCVAAPRERMIGLVNGDDVIQNTLEDGRRCYTLRDNEPFDVFLPKQEPPTNPQRQEPLLYAERSFTGHGQEHGGVKTVLRNPSETDSIEVVYLESLPWFMKPYLHTLKAQLLPPPPWDADKHAGKVISELYYRPALDRERGTQLEAKIVVPPDSIVIMTYDFEKAVLRYTEYPPDANRGFDVASAIITIPPHRRRSDGKFVPATSIRTTSLLLSLPTPDFSMPYNVIIFTSTIMALAFGSIFNLLVRRFVAVDEVQRMDLKGKIKGLLGKLSKRKVE